MVNRILFFSIYPGKSNFVPELEKKYFKLPKEKTNPRGVDLSKDGLIKMLSSPSVLKIEIEWIKKDIKFDPYKRWIDYWRN